LLGSLKEAELRQWFVDRPLPAITTTTITDPKALLEDVRKGRRQGYFQTHGENVSDVWAVATLLDVNKETFAIAVAGPRHRMEGSVQDVAHLVVATGSFISQKLQQ
jgi:IclR family acetate operon transcriptional repressor